MSLCHKEDNSWFIKRQKNESEIGNYHNYENRKNVFDVTKSKPGVTYNESDNGRNLADGWYKKSIYDFWIFFIIFPSLFISYTWNLRTQADRWWDRVVRTEPFGTDQKIFEILGMKNFSQNWTAPIKTKKSRINSHYKNLFSDGSWVVWIRLYFTCLPTSLFLRLICILASFLNNVVFGICLLVRRDVHPCPLFALSKHDFVLYFSVKSFASMNCFDHFSAYPKSSPHGSHSICWNNLWVRDKWTWTRPWSDQPWFD